VGVVPKRPMTFAEGGCFKKKINSTGSIAGVGLSVKLVDDKVGKGKRVPFDHG